MTRDRPNTEDSTGTDNETSRPNGEEPEELDLDRAAYLTRALARSEVLDRDEAQAFVFRKMLNADRQRTAEETDMTPSDVSVYCLSAEVRIARVRKLIEIIDEHTQ